MTVADSQLSPVSEKLSIWRKIGYGLGDIYGGGLHIAISFYYKGKECVDLWSGMKLQKLELEY